MKKICIHITFVKVLFVSILFTLFFTSVNAQWVNSGSGINYPGDNSVVGIGEANPQKSLDIKSIYDVPPAIRLNYLDGTPSIWDIKNEYGLEFSYGISTSVQNLKVIFKNDGKVGIGVFYPKAFLDVANTSENTLKTVLARLSEGNTTGDGTYLGARSYTTSTINGVSFALEHKFYNITNSSINFHRGGGTTGGFITFNTNNNTEKVRIDANGNVGIGTTNPTSKLYVSGDINSLNLITRNNLVTSGDFAITNPDGTLFEYTDHLAIGYPNGRIAFNGKVGIGTNSPTSSLSIGPGIGNLHYGTNGVLIKFNTGDRALLELHSPDGQNRLVFQSLSAASYLASLDKKPLLLQFDGGKVGIGTLNPIEALHVKGRIYLEGTETTNNGWQQNYFCWRGHSLILGTEQGVYAHNAVEMKPGGASEGTLESIFTMFNATGIGQNTQKVQIHTNGDTYFNGGNVGIGVVAPTYKLDVNGTIHAKEVIVDLNFPADYVFEKSYQLMKLADVEKFVTENKHLPGIPSGKTIIANGLNMGEMQNKLLEKVEELTLYVIEQNKILQDQKEKLLLMQEKINELENKK